MRWLKNNAQLLIAPLILVAVFVVLDNVYPSLAPNYLSGLATETAGIVLTIILIDLILQRREESKRLQVQKAGFASLRRTLFQYLRYWQRISGFHPFPADLDRAILDLRSYLTSDEFIDGICNRSFDDIDIPGDMMGPFSAIPFRDTVQRKAIELLRSECRNMLMTYAQWLDTEAVELLSYFSSINSFYNTFDREGLGESKNSETGKTNQWLIWSGKQKITRDHFERFAQLIDEHNSNVEPKLAITAKSLGGWHVENAYDENMLP